MILQMEGRKQVKRYDKQGMGLPPKPDERSLPLSYVSLPLRNSGISWGHATTQADVERMVPLTTQRSELWRRRKPTNQHLF